mmetsp:Transcript_89423/g.239665  ORF Transcript_89423/g.239665 Transcript_89423/m.239665 type:complete len:223 (-) Transcript_89423:35-703(-)
MPPLRNPSEYPPPPPPFFPPLPFSAPFHPTKPEAAMPESQAGMPLPSLPLLAPFEVQEGSKPPAIGMPIPFPIIATGSKPFPGVIIGACAKPLPDCGPNPNPVAIIGDITNISSLSKESRAKSGPIASRPCTGPMPGDINGVEVGTNPGDAAGELLLVSWRSSYSDTDRCLPSQGPSSCEFAVGSSAAMWRKVFFSSSLNLSCSSSRGAVSPSDFIPPHPEY